MYRKQVATKTSIRSNDSVEGESIEMKIERIVNNKEAITDGSPLIFTERTEGVLPAYDVRTDRFDVAIDAMDRIDRDNKAKREAKHKPKEEKKEVGKPESTSGDTSTTGE